MKSLFLSLLCAAPLVVGYGAYDIAQPVPAAEPAVQAEEVYLTSMGCDLVDCTDPAHYHYCVYGCTEAEHYHDCPVGCADPSHPCCGQCWEYTEEAAQTFCPSMGCDLVNCTDPTHFHNCPYGCTEEAHYHDCPLGCQNAVHAHGGWSQGGGHHGGGHGHHGWRR